MYIISEDETVHMNQIILQTNLVKEGKLLRETFLTLLPDLIKFDAASFFLAGTASQPFEEQPVIINLGDLFMRKYSEYIVYCDELFPYIIDNKPFTYKATDLKSLEECEMYNSFLKPQGLKYAQGMNFVWADKFMGAVVLFRGKGSFDFSNKDMFLFKQFQEHISFNLYECDKIKKNKEKQKENFMADYKLTKKELNIVELITRGYTNLEISQAMFISVNTVKTHLKHIFRKLGISNRTQIQAMLNRW